MDISVILLPKIRVFASLSVALALSLAAPRPANAASLTIDASQIDGVIPAIHGITNGPIISNAPGSAPPCGNNHPADHTARFQELKVPQTRTHGGGEVDMDKLWLPYPEYAGHDPTDPNNYDWSRADAAVEQIIAAGSTPYLRFGHSKNHSSSGSCIANLNTRTPPDDFAVFAQVTRHILKHFLSGWDNGFTYDIEFVEVWNEFYIGEFWAGDGTQAAQLYEAVYNACKPDFPDVMLGPSINKPTSQQNRIPWDFWDYVKDNEIPVDFISAHIYHKRPRMLEDRVYRQTDRSWEFLFSYVGLPADTPIVNAEWNRDGGCYNTGKGQTIPAGAFVAGSLITMAGMHPQNSNHNLVMSHLFSARSQLWTESSQPKGPGVGIAAYAHLVENTPDRLSLTGPFSTDDGVDFRAIAGTNEDGTEVGLLVSYYDITNTDCPGNADLGPPISLELEVQNLPWGNGGFDWERWVHTSNGAMTLAESGSGSGGILQGTKTIQGNVLERYVLREAGCGNGIVAGAEQCDDGRINGSASSCCAGDCTFEPTGPANCDGELCTTGDSCDMGVCTPGDCRDGESCSVCGGSCSTTQADCGCVF